MSSIGAWLDSNPLSILAIVILIMVLAGRGLISNQGRVTGDLIKIVTTLAESVGKLEVLYREQVITLNTSDVRQEQNQVHIEQRLANIETSIEKCIKDHKNGSNI